MNQSEENLFVDTPENITFGYQIAGIGSRFLAALVDTTIILLLQILVNMVLIMVLAKGADLKGMLSSGDFLTSSASWVIALMGLISFFFFWGYYIFFEMLWNGQSPGKSLAKLRVIRADGTPITLTESIVRNLVRLIDFLPIYYGIGVVSMFINSQSRRLGDLAAGTLVIRESAEKLTLKSLGVVDLHLPASSSNAAPILDAASQKYALERLTQQDIQMIESFLARREGLNNRKALARQLADSVLSRMGIAEAERQTSGVEDTLVDILQAYRAKQNNAGHL